MVDPSGIRCAPSLAILGSGRPSWSTASAFCDQPGYVGFAQGRSSRDRNSSGTNLLPVIVGDIDGRSSACRSHAGSRVVVFVLIGAWTAAIDIALEAMFSVAARLRLWDSRLLDRAWPHSRRSFVVGMGSAADVDRRSVRAVNRMARLWPRGRWWGDAFQRLRSLCFRTF